MKPELELYQAVQTGSLDTVKQLLRVHSKIDINFVPDLSEVDQNDFLAQEGNTALLYALSAEKLEAALELLKHKADPWKSNNFNLNALHMLMMVHQNLEPKKIQMIMDLLQVLLSDKQISEKINQQGRDDKRSPLALAISYPPLEILKLLITELMKKGGQYLSEDPIWAQVLDAPDAMKKIIYIESNLPEKLSSNEELMKVSPKFGNKTALQAAVVVGNVAFLNYCLTKLGVKNCLENINNPQLPALQIALEQNPLNQDIIVTLLDAGADPGIVHKGTKKSFNTRLKELAEAASKGNYPRPDAETVFSYLENRKREKFKNK